MDKATALQPIFIQTAPEFLRMTGDLRSQRRIAVDTESNSLHAYRERVCLLQFSTDTRDYIVDPLALESLDPLGAIFSAAGIEKIFHAAEYDLVGLRRDFGFSSHNIFDTMQAGRILGRKLAGLDRLLEEKFGIQVNKRFQKADWGARPLAAALLQYAAQDTHFLIPLRDMLEEELHAKGFWELAREDFRIIAGEAAGPKPRPESPSWSRFLGRRELKPRDLAILKELVAWRESVAASLDRPPFKVLDDNRLMDIARARPSSLEDLRAVGLTARQMAAWGEQLLPVVRRGLHAKPVQRPRAPLPDPSYLRRLEKLKLWRKKTAAAMDVESDVVLPRVLMLALAEGGAHQAASVMSRSPSRQQRFGAELLQLLQAVPGA
jgi:ribonuclease D